MTLTKKEMEEVFEMISRATTEDLKKVAKMIGTPNESLP